VVVQEVRNREGIATLLPATSPAVALPANDMSIFQACDGGNLPVESGAPIASANRACVVTCAVHVP
jgi:hypothetical protein